jgi:hypothetical protein
VLAAGEQEKKKSKEGKSEEKGESSEGKSKGRVEFDITTHEREVIQEYYAPGKKGKHLPPGLAKKVARGGKLPPGWEKKMVKGETMPVEVYQQCVPLPKEILVQLPAPPAGTITVTVGGKAARLLEATHEILDVFDVLPKPPAPRP